MGYSVEATVLVGVTLSPTSKQLEQIEAFCQECKDLQYKILDYGEDQARVYCCVYVQCLKLEEWGYNENIDQNLEEKLNLNESHKANIAQLLRVLNKKPQDMKLVLNLRGG